MKDIGYYLLTAAVAFKRNSLLPLGRQKVDCTTFPSRNNSIWKSWIQSAGAFGTQCKLNPKICRVPLSFVTRRSPLSSSGAAGVGNGFSFLDAGARAFVAIVASSTCQCQLTVHEYFMPSRVFLRCLLRFKRPTVPRRSLLTIEIGPAEYRR